MAITNGYCALSELKTYMGLTGSGQDDNLENAIEGASRQIDSVTGRRFYQDGTVTTRYFTPDNSFYLFVPDISTTTGLVVKLDDNDDGTHETTLTINTDFIVEPVNAGQNQVQYQPFTKVRILDTRSSERFDASIVNNVKIEAKWGFSSVPDAIKQATFLQATRLFKRKDTPFTTYGGQSTGNIDLQFNFDDDAMELIKGYKKNKL
jgi:hypothetical protein